MNKSIKNSNSKLSLRDRCNILAAEFSPILAARVRQAKAAKIMNARTSYKFRLNQLVSMDCRKGTVFEVPASCGSFMALSLVDTMNFNLRRSAPL